MHSNYNILLIDDDQDDIMLFTHAAQNISGNARITCTAIDNCAAALQKLQLGLRPDIIFLDLNMPVLHGFECLNIIKQSDAFGNVPVIIYSTSGYSADVDKARSLGAAGYMKKPSDFGNLTGKIERFITHVASGSATCLVDV